MTKSFQFEDIFQQEDIVEIEKYEKELKQAGSAARACLNLEQFAEYKRRMVKVESQMVDVMISFTNDYFNEMNGDMAFYGAKIARFLTKIQNLRMLLRAVEMDARTRQGEQNESSDNG